jgi:hypothetical protein
MEITQDQGPCLPKNISEQMLFGEKNVENQHNCFDHIFFTKISFVGFLWHKILL